MASRKEYDMIFELNARMNGGFSGTFSKAQAEFSRLGKEVQELQKLQGNITSYQKQQSAIDSTRTKLENLRQQHDLLQKEIGETTESTASLERENLKLEQRIKDTEAALGRQEQRLQSTGEKLKEVGVDTANLSQKDAELTARIKDLKAEQDKAAESASGFGSKAAQAFDAAGQALAAAGIAAAMKEITDAFVECVGIAADFEETMSTVEALSQANAEEMAALAAEAKELGATTKFTAKESAEAMNYMAMAGWDAQDMLSGMNGVLQLAAASGEDLAMVSDIVTDSLTAFGLTAADTAHFSDVLAAAATNSNTNVAIMGETFKRSASVAGALGYSIEDVAVAMGLMANSGVKGSIAGTALLNTFNGLLEGVTLTGKAFGEYEYSAVKADGTMKDFGATIDELRRYFDRMTDAERVNNAMAIAGQRGYGGLLAILNATDADYSSLANNINNCTGAAERMARVKMDNLNGQLTLMNSAWDALKTTIGEELNPELRRLAETATDMLGWLNDFVKENPSLVKGVAAGAAVFGTLATTITGVSAAVKLLKSVLSPAALGMIGAAGILSLATMSFTIINDAVSAYAEVLDVHRRAEEAYQDSIAAIDKEADATYSLIAQLRELSGQSEKTEADQAKIANIVDRLNSAIPELNLSYDKETDSLKGLSGSVDSYVESLYAAQKAERDVARAVDLVGSIEETDAALADAVAELEKLQKQYDGLVASGGELGGISTTIDVYRAKVKQLEDQLAAEKTEYDALTQSTKDYYDAQNEAARATADATTVIENATERVMELAAAYREAYEEAYASFSGLFGLYDEAERKQTTMADLQKALDSQISYFSEYTSNLETLKAAAERYGIDISGIWDKISDGTPDDFAAVAALVGSVNSGDLAALDKYVGAYADLQKELESLSDFVAQEDEAVIAALEQAEKDIAEAVEETAAYNEAYEAMQTTIQGYLDGLEDGTGSVSRAIGRASEQWKQSIISLYEGYLDTRGGSAQSSVQDDGYASGTDNARPGWHLVGENGPELLFFRGGEKVLNASQTAALQSKLDADLQMAAIAPQLVSAMTAHSSAEGAMISSSGASSLEINVPVSIQVNGNATNDVLDSLQDYGNNLAETVAELVRDALEEERIEAKRRAY